LILASRWKFAQSGHPDRYKTSLGYDFGPPKTCRMNVCRSSEEIFSCKPSKSTEVMQYIPERAWIDPRCWG
jgi:hypothetical protein